MDWLSDVRPVFREATAGLAREAVERFPDRPVAWAHLAERLIEEQSYREAIDVLGRAGARFPTVASFYSLRSRAARGLGDRRTAFEATSEAIRLAPDDPDVVLAHFEASMVCGALDQARLLLESVLSLVRDRLANGQIQSLQRVMPYLVDVLAHAKRFDEAVALMRTVVDRLPGWSQGVYLFGLSLARAGQRDEARLVVDPDRYTRRMPLGVLGNFPNHAELKRALIDEIRRNPTLEPDPAETTLRHGSQTRLWMPDGDRALETVVTAIRPAIDAYSRDLPLADEHPFVRGRPASAMLSLWAVIYPEQGHQEPHIHRCGWLSGTYYVAVPASTSTPDGGALVLGGPLDDEPAVDAPWGTRTIVPREGELILFPSWLPHSTRPTGSHEPRVSISFDVIPAA